MKKLLIILFIIYNINTSWAFLDCLKNLNKRSYDGSCNNILLKDLGKRDTYFRHLPEGREKYPWVHETRLDPLPTYSELYKLPWDGPRGNPRDITNALTMRHDTERTDPLNHSMFSTIFGQFINHDMENNRMVDFEHFGVAPMTFYLLDTEDYSCKLHTGRPFPHPPRCNPDDPVLYANQKLSGGDIQPDGTLAVYNNATSFLDMHFLYGLDDEMNSLLRTKSHGKLKTTPLTGITLTDSVKNIEYTTEFREMPPAYAELQLPVEANYPALGNHSQFFVGGDDRINENMGLTAIHIMWLREHNKVCDELIESTPKYRNHPVKFDEEIFQLARDIVISKYQHIIYEQYIPSVFGQYFKNKIGPHQYNSLVDPSVSNAFASAAFRYGHFTVRPYFALDKCGNSYERGSISPDQTAKQIYIGFINPTPDYLTPMGRFAECGGMGNIFRGLINEKVAPNDLDAEITMRNFTQSWGVADIIAFDIQRARANNVPNYQTLRRHYYGDNNLFVNNIYGSAGCPLHLQLLDNMDDPLPCYLMITSNITVANQLKSVYRKVKLIDPIIGIQAEDKVPGTSFGRTGGHIIVDQFKRLQNGDRFFYKQLIKNKRFKKDQEQKILNTTMGEIIRRNLFEDPDFPYPDNPFISPENYRQTLIDSCLNNNH